VASPNLELVRRNYEVVNSIGRTDSGFIDPEDVAPDLWSRLAEDFELHERADLPDAKVYRGRDQSKEFWRRIQDVFAELRWEPQELIDLGDVIVVEAKLTAVGRGSDVRLELTETDVFWFREGMLVRLQAFATRAEALEAARGATPGGG
jgi:ketosteroid isomerase-like protein